MAFNGQLLSHFDGKPEDQVLCLSGNLAEIIKGLYPSLSLSELARLILALREAGHEALIPDLLKAYHLRDSSLEVLARLVTLPIDVQNWISEKALGLQDCQVLTGFSDFQRLADLIRSLQNLRASKSLAMQILELCLELHLMGHQDQELAPKSQSAESWLKDLRCLRFPMSSQLDSKQAASLKSIPFPPKLQAKWQRQGDLSGVEIRFFAQSHQELTKFIEGLDRVQPELKDKLWNQR